MAKRIRGVMFEENLKNSMGLEFYNLSHRFGYQSPNWPYFEDVKIERIHYMAKSGVLSQRITTSMHNTTHIDAPAHVVQGTPFIDEVPLPHFFGSGIVVSLPKNKWEPITGDDLEKACGKIIRPRDVVIINTGWHKLTEIVFAIFVELVPAGIDDHDVAWTNDFPAGFFQVIAGDRLPFVLRQRHHDARAEKMWQRHFIDKRRPLHDVGRRIDMGGVVH